MPQPNPHIVIIAGEASGDAHAAKLIHELRSKNPNLVVSGIGGQNMEQAGATLVYNLAQYGVTGFTEVFRHFKIIKDAFKRIKEHLKAVKPDLLILVDYPGFNLRLAKYAKEELGIKIIYYISPQIWAWKAGRIHHIKKYIDHMAVIFPFEKTIYQNAGVPVSFVGHPLQETIPQHYDMQHARQSLSLPEDQRIIALLPGSRKHEIESLLPVMLQTAQILSKHHANTHYVVPIADTINEDAIKRFLKNSDLNVTLIKGKAIDAMCAADFVIVASGTASLECALLKKPMCILYKSSTITYYLAMKLIKIKYLGLCNILSNAMIAPEFLQHDCKASEIARYIELYFSSPDLMTTQQNQLELLARSLASENSDCSLSDLVYHELGN